MSDDFPSEQLLPDTHHQEVPSELAKLDHFLRLHQSQWEFLAWLNAIETKSSTKGESYRKIR